MQRSAPIQPKTSEFCPKIAFFEIDEASAAPRRRSRRAAARACRAPEPLDPGLEVIGLPCPPSSRPADRGRRCFCLFCETAAGCNFVCVWRSVHPSSRAARVGTSPTCPGEALSIGASFCAVLQVTVVCSRSAEHIVSAGAQIYPNRSCDSSKQEYAR